MRRIEGVMLAVEYALNNKRKRHILGGVLMSAALLFAGLSITVITLKNEEKESNEQLIE